MMMNLLRLKKKKNYEGKRLVAYKKLARNSTQVDENICHLCRWLIRLMFYINISHVQRFPII